jgi:hypothetical protein
VFGRRGSRIGADIARQEQKGNIKIWLPVETDRYASTLLSGFVQRQRQGIVMSRFKPSAQRRSVTVPIAPQRGRMLSDRAYVELGRQPRLGDVSARRAPYIEAVATALAFAFLTYLVLGGA